MLYTSFLKTVYKVYICYFLFYFMKTVMFKTLLIHVYRIRCYCALYS